MCARRTAYAHTRQSAARQRLDPAKLFIHLHFRFASSIHDLARTRGACPSCGSLTLSVCITPRVTIEFGLATSLGFFFLGAMAVLLGQLPLADVVWLGARLGDIVTVLSAIALLSPIPTLFITSLAALRQLERVGSVENRRSNSAERDGGAVLRETPTQDYVRQPPPSVAEHTTLRLTIDETDWEQYDLPTTRPN